MHCLKMYRIPDGIIMSTEKTREDWRAKLTARGRSLAQVKIQRGIFLGDALSTLLFIIAMMPLSHILRKRSITECTLMISTCLRIIKKNWKLLMQGVRIFSQDIGMEFGIENCAMLIMRSRKRNMREGLELPNQEKKSERSEKKKLTNSWEQTTSN